MVVGAGVLFNACTFVPIAHKFVSHPLIYISWSSLVHFKV